MQNVPITEAGLPAPPPDTETPKAIAAIESKLAELAARPALPPVINIRTPEIKAPPAPVTMT